MSEIPDTHSAYDLRCIFDSTFTIEDARLSRNGGFMNRVWIAPNERIFGIKVTRTGTYIFISTPVGDAQ
jgi:hypothetical protein